MFGFFKRRRRARLRTSAFPVTWRAILLEKFPLFANLTEADRQELQGHILVFLDEKRFEGCGGFEITDEVRVLIAAQACLLLLHRESDYYSSLRTILVYPETYVAKTRWREEDEDTDRASRARLGESWKTGAVVLAWSSTLAGAINPEDGQNVTLHEFAHQLDQEDGAANGVPPLAGAGVLQRYGRHVAWARVMRAEFVRLQTESAKGHRTLLDYYGAANAAEFFAVATECFFEKPRQMQKKHPELYEELRRFYRQNPVAFGGAAPPGGGNHSSAT